MKKKKSIEKDPKKTGRLLLISIVVIMIVSQVLILISSLPLEINNSESWISFIILTLKILKIMIWIILLLGIIILLQPFIKHLWGKIKKFKIRHKKEKSIHCKVRIKGVFDTS